MRKSKSTEELIPGFLRSRRTHLHRTDLSHRLEERRTLPDSRCHLRRALPWRRQKNIWWRFANGDSEPWAIAGLWSEWKDFAKGEVVPNHTKLTMNADAYRRPPNQRRGLPTGCPVVTVVAVSRPRGESDRYCCKWLLLGSPRNVEAAISAPETGRSNKLRGRPLQRVRAAAKRVQTHPALESKNFREHQKSLVTLGTWKVARRACDTGPPRRARGVRPAHTARGVTSAMAVLTIIYVS